MFISHKHKCIFVHIPKTAGSSVHRALVEKMHPELDKSMLQRFSDIPIKKSNTSLMAVYELSADGIYIKRGHDGIITTKKNLKGTMLESYINKYFTFCFVRNPWDRFVSAHAHLIDRRRRGPELPYKTFNDFILGNIRSEKIHTKLLKQLHFEPQYKYILDSNNNINIDFIGRFENLHEDFDIICKKIGIKTPKLRHNNKSHHKSYQTYYTDKTAEIIYNAYKEDIDYFDYSFNF
jgi:hypothetical protein